MDSTIFHRLYDTYHADLFRFLLYLVGDRTDAEDLSHEVYVRVLRSYHRFEGRSSEKTWLFSIAKHVAIDHFRKKAVRSKHADSSFDWETMELKSPDRQPEDDAMLNEEKRELYNGLQHCTEDQRLVLALRYFQQMSVKETAEILQWSPSKVKTTQHRAIQKLKQWMQASNVERGEPDEPLR